MNLVTEQNVIRVKMALFGGLFIFGFFVIIAVPVTTVRLIPLVELAAMNFTLCVCVGRNM